MRKPTRYALLYWATLPLLGRAQAPPQKTQLQGTVVSTAGQPIRKAKVRLENVNSRSGKFVDFAGTSDENGRFEFDDITAGHFTLGAEKSGFVEGHYGARTPTSPAAVLNVGPGDKLENLVIWMTPQGAIGGRVLDQDGDPLSNAEVSLMRLAYQHGRKEFVPAGSAVSDDRGSFRISDLVPGRYYISVQDRDVVTLGREERPGKPGAGHEGYPLTYYPGGTDASAASPIDVTAGAELSGVSIELRRGPLFSIRGRVVDAVTGGPPRQLVVYALPRDASGGSIKTMMSRTLQQVRPDGSFEIPNLSPGVYVVQNLTSFSTSNGVNAIGIARAEVVVGSADVDGVGLILAPGIEVNGRMYFDQAQTSVPTFRAHIELVPSEPTVLATPASQLVGTGAFQIKGAPPSRFLVNVSGLPDNIYVKSIRFANADLTNQPMDLSSGAAGSLDVVLSSNAADVTGAVRDSKGEPLAGISVSLWPKDLNASSPWTRVRTAVSDQSGGFRFGGLGPGDYFVAAWDGVEAGLLQNAEFLSRFTGNATVFKLEEGSHQNANPELIPPDKISAEIARLP